MRIKINNWNIFEKINAYYFTRNININDELEVYAVYESKSKQDKKSVKYLLVYVDFYTFKKLLFIEEGNYFDVLDTSFSQEFISVSEYVSIFKDKEDFCEVKMGNLITKKWMVEENDFFAWVIVNDLMAQKKFENIENLI